MDKGGTMSAYKLLFRRKLGSGDTIPRKRSVLALIVTVLLYLFLSVSGCSQEHVPATQVKTETVPSGYLELTVSPAEICANVGERIEIRCYINPLIDTPIEISSVDLVLFDSNDSIIREQAIAPDYRGIYWPGNTEYTVVGDEAYYRIKVDFAFAHGPSGNYSEYGARSFPIVVNQ
jgi:hypothetical protein